MSNEHQMFPLFLDLSGRLVVLVGSGPVADAKARQFADAGAELRRIATDAFTPADLDGAWLVVAAATPEVNRLVASAANERRLFINAVDDIPNATAYLSGTVRRDGVTVAISTNGEAPALTALLREALDAVLPEDLGAWLTTAREQRASWKRDGVAMDARKPLLLDALNRRYSVIAENAEPDSPPASAASTAVVGRAVGHVSLVGAGPGDPGLLTRLAVARLRQADLVLYDALIDPRVLRYARKAQKFFVGKRAGRHAVSQERIQALMIRAARRGRRVVRLKGGDPFVFGRGGEEALALRRAGVSYDVVAGVTSAIAAPASAGIPVTHRGTASGFLVVSGHDTRAFLDAIGAARPNAVTLVILMGVERAAALACALVDRGWRRSTPAALVMDGTTTRQQTWRGTLDDLARDGVTLDSAGPGTIVIGDVVGLNTSAAQAFRPADSAIAASRTYVSRR
jgi:uroporphyrin-III C-methyltransferase/precorrin-2 dehydrogenase/sirohydrochlorin ferrochelatase